MRVIYRAKIIRLATAVMMIAIMTTLMGFSLQAIGQELASSKSKPDAPGSSTSKPADKLLNQEPTPETSERLNREIKITIEGWQDRVRKRLAAIDKLSSTLDLKKVQSQRVVSTELLEMIQDLDEEAGAIIGAYESLGPDLEFYRKALLQAPPAFEKIAKDIEKAATGKRSVALQQTYSDFATQSRKLATHYSEQANSITGLETQVEEKIGFVRESREFFTDVRKLLEAIPADSGFNTEKLVDRMNNYIDVFQKAIDAMRNVGEKITVKESNSTKKATPIKAASTRQDPFAGVGR